MQTPAAHNDLETGSPLTPPGVSPSAACAWHGLAGSSRGLALVVTARRYAGPLLVIAADSRNLVELEEEIRFYGAGGPDLPMFLFPDWENLPYDSFSPHTGIISQRLRTLSRLPALTQGLVLTTVSTVMHRLPPRSYVHAHSLSLRRGERLEIPAFRTRLQQAAYSTVAQVMEPGEYAVRGGLIDLFPPGSPTPFRLDLFDDQIESIREFDPDSQRSGAVRESIELLPAREFPLTEDGIRQFRQAFRASFAGDPQTIGLYRSVSDGLCPAGIEYYLPLFFPATETLFDYLPSQALCALEAGCRDIAHRFADETRERYEQFRHDRERPILPPERVFLDEPALCQAVENHPRIELTAFEHHLPTETTPAAVDSSYGFATQPPPALPVNQQAPTPYAAFIDYLQAFDGRILLVAETPGRRETLRGVLNEYGLFPAEFSSWSDFLQSTAALGLIVAQLDKGLLLSQPRIAVITETQLYGDRVVQRRRRAAKRHDTGMIVRSLAELELGDPVVHMEHGIGRYRGLQILDIGDGKTEFLTLSYAGDDKLYIPVTALHLISRYTGAGPESAPLHRLGGDAWERAKKRAQQKAHDAAAELLEIAALRESREGYRFPSRDQQYLAFLEAFPFEETPDQERAIEEVLNDMESAQPMDRLVCGDVGFGKTEVALRAAFLAAQGMKQVAILVPTTLLAQQHYQNFCDRFANFPVRVALLSRFKTRKEQQRIITDIAAGKTDIVIGTHRLLQDDIRFPNLGLIILDEEHRFGVRQKERLKKLRSEVDILTLTATPIPRTLNMALADLREISIIATPPAHRLSIKTFVSEWRGPLIREACLREIRRGGQVYYLHNEVKTMARVLAQLQDLVPEADIRMAHGQMPERELEGVMSNFYHQRFSILLCSTIIESGIDIPTANTIIIERADKFGLAQLHQLRGRVGRSNHRAYAYLLIPPRRALSQDALKRIDAIVSMEELGSGFMLASHDLEIRGAGELLGEAQSGEIDEVGFTLYLELLQRAVKSLREGKLPADIEPISPGADINIHAPALLSDDYLPDVHMRLMLYKRIASATEQEELREIKEEAIDRFGQLQPAGELLFKVATLKIAATPIGIKKIDAGPKGVRIDFTESPNIDAKVIIDLIHEQPHSYRMDGPNRLRIIGVMDKIEDRINAIEGFLSTLARQYH